MKKLSETTIIIIWTLAGFIGEAILPGASLFTVIGFPAVLTRVITGSWTI